MAAVGHVSRYLSKLGYTHRVCPLKKQARKVPQVLLPGTVSPCQQGQHLSA